MVRYSDDGEPQGTAGQPMLNVFQREEVTNVCCVVTRYFGGVLLGAGGLTRAYTKGAKDALDAVGISTMSPVDGVGRALHIPPLRAGEAGHRRLRRRGADASTARTSPSGRRSRRAGRSSSPPA